MHMPVSESAIITPNDKQFPWPGAEQQWAGRMLKRTGFKDAIKTLQELGTKKSIKYIGVEDYQHFFNNMMYSDKWAEDGASKDRKWTRYEELGRLAAQIIITANELPSDKFVFITAHTELMEGQYVMQLFGNMVRNNVKPEGWVEIILHAVPIPEKTDPQERYRFLTHHNGTHQAKSPYGMFKEDYIPNDLRAVVAAINEFSKPSTPNTTA